MTQRQIAEHLGLSPQAVNFALGHRSHQVSPETRRRVMVAAAKLGYRANAAAQAVSTGRFNAAGLLMSLHHCQSTIFGDMLRGIHVALDVRGVHLAVTFVDDDRLTGEGELPKILGQAMVDGLLLNYTHDIPPRMVEMINRHRISAIWMNSKQSHDCVHPDDLGAGHQAANLLLKAGHQRIAYVDLTAGLEDSNEWHYSRADRLAGYEQAMTEAGFEPSSTVTTDHLTHEGPVRTARQMLEADCRPTAIVAYCNADAQAFMLACSQMGLSPGRDLSMVMIDQNQPLIGPKIDTFLLPEFDVGQAAARMLLDRLDQPSARQPVRAVPMKYKPGETVSLCLSD